MLDACPNFQCSLFMSWQTLFPTAANEKLVMGLTCCTVPHMNPFCIFISLSNFNFKSFFSTTITWPVLDIVQFFDIATVRLKDQPKNWECTGHHRG